MAALRRTLAPLSPAHRRWRRFLADLTLDPTTLPRPLEAPGERDFMICGSPRTGTSLLAAALFQPPRVVTVMEPWDGMRLPPADLFRSLRTEIDTTGRLARGRLDVSALEDERAVRWNLEGSGAHAVATAPDYLVGVKWPAYWRYLEALPDTRFLVCVRDPFTTVASFRRAGGNVARGLQRDLAFNREQNRDLRRATRSPEVRRALLYEYAHQRLLPFVDRHTVFVVHYERWFEDRDELVSELQRFLGVELSVEVAIRPRAPHARLSPREVAVVRRYCRSAEAFGYRLDRSP